MYHLSQLAYSGSVSTTTYDIAVSFAGEQRVADFVEACKVRGTSVFYDCDLINGWWGKNFVREQREIYSKSTRYFMLFIPTEYLAKAIPRDEVSATMMTAVNQGDGYVLPVLWTRAQAQLRELLAESSEPH